MCDVCSHLVFFHSNILLPKDFTILRWFLSTESLVKTDSRAVTNPDWRAQFRGAIIAMAHWHRSSSISSTTHCVPDVIPPLTLSLSSSFSHRVSSRKETDIFAASLSSPYLSVSFSPPSPLDASRALCSRWLYNWEAATSYVRHSDDLASPSASPRPRPTGPRSITS